MTPPLPVIGWVVLTRQPDGRWLPDWDGELHTDHDQAVAEHEAAAARLGADQTQLAEVHGVTSEGAT